MVLDVTAAAKAVLERNVAYRVEQNLRMAVRVLLGKTGGYFAVSSSASTDQDHRTDCRPQVTGVNLLMPLVEPKWPRAGRLSMSLVAQAIDEICLLSTSAGPASGKASLEADGDLG